MHSSPFVGMRPFEPEERDRFFGRERDARYLCDKILTARLTILYAQSGLGKSSLLKALVIPHLQESTAIVTYFDAWRQDDPTAAIKHLLACEASELGVASPSAGAPSLVQLARLIDSVDHRSVVVVLDQFEELLISRGPRLDTFKKELAALVRAEDLDLQIVLALREEFIAALEPFRQDILTLFQSTYRLEPLDRASVRQAIEEPAKAFGRPCEKDPDLVAAIIADLERRQREKSADGKVTASGYGTVTSESVELPILQLVCSELWNASEEQLQLTLALYKEMGGAEGIIERYVRAVMPPPGQDETTARLLQFLAPDSGYKQSFSCEELSQHTDLSSEIVLAELRRLAGARILRTRSFRGDERFELQHDAFAEVLWPWRDAVLDRLRNEKRIADENRARQQRRKQRITAAAVMVLCMLAAGLPASSWLGDRQKLRLNTVGQLEPLRGLSPDQAWQIGPTLERVVTYLLFQRQDDDRFERLRSLLIEYADLMPKIPSYGVNYAGNEYLPLPDSSWPLQLEYSTSRIDPDNPGAWEAGFRSEWHLYMQEIAQNWGVPLPHVIRVTEHAEFPRSKAVIAYAGHAPLEITLPDFRDDRPVINPAFLKNPGQEQGLKFFEAFAENWGRPLALELPNPVDYYRVPQWSIPVWNLLNGESKLSPASSVAALTVASRLLDTPDMLITEGVVDTMLRRVGSEHSQAVAQARAVRGAKLRTDLAEIIRLDRPLTGNHLVLALDYLAMNPGADSRTAAAGVLNYLDHVSVDVPRRLSGPGRAGNGSEGAPASSNQWYEEAFLWLPRVDRPLQLVLSQPLAKELTRRNENGTLDAAPDLQNAYQAYRDDFFARFGVDFPEWELQSDSSLSGNTARLRILNQRNTNDAEAFEAASIDGIVQALRFRAEVRRTYWINVDQSFNESSRDRNEASSLLRPASPLRRWLERRYSKTDLVRIQRAVVEPTADELRLTETTRNGDSLRIPPHHTLRHPDWLLSSLAFWFALVDPLDLDAIADSLRQTQRARLNPHEFRAGTGDVSALVHTGITDLLAERYDGAEQVFARAIAGNRRAAVAAFLELYPREYAARQLAKFSQGCDGHRLSRGTFGRADHVDLVDFVKTLPAGSPRTQSLRLCIAAAAPSDRQWMAVHELRQLLTQHPDPQAWPAEEALWLGEVLLSVDPVRPADLWRTSGLDFVRSGVRRSGAGNDHVRKAFDRFLQRCNEDGPRNWCWTLMRDIVASRPQDGMPFDLANHLSYRETRSDLEDAIRRIDTLGSAEVMKLLRHNAEKSFASLGESAMRTSAEQGYRTLLKSRDAAMARYARRGLVELLVDRGEFAEAARLANDGIRRIDTENASGYLIDMYFVALLSEGADAADAVLERLHATLGSDNADYRFYLALHGTLTQSRSGEENARAFLGMQHRYTNYIAMMLFSAMRGTATPSSGRSGALSPAQEQADELLARRWATIEPDRPNWPARIRGGDVSAWRELLIGYYRDQVPAADIFGPLETDAAFAASDLRFLPMPRQAMLTEAYFYDAMLARSNGDTERMTRRLESIMQLGYTRYIEYRLAWFLLQQIRGAPVRPGS